MFTLCQICINGTFRTECLPNNNAKLHGNQVVRGREKKKKTKTKKSTFISKQESSWPRRKAGLSLVKSLSVDPLKTEGERVMGL